jgi:basic membrane protein A and related proteins
MIKFGPKTQLTSIIDNWVAYYDARVRAELAGNRTSSDTWGGLKSNLVVMAPYTNMPDDVKQMAQATEAAIVAGTLHPFKCPVIAQNGQAVACKNGKNHEDGQILGMNFYLKGVDDKRPGK